MLDWWLPENVSTYGQEIDWLFHLIYYITGATFVLVFVTMLVFLVMYRDRPGRRARYTHGNTTLEIVWTVVPALILVILTILSVPAWSKIKMTMPETDFVVQVTAKQFNWQVTYPGPDGQFGTADDKTLLDEMHVPVNKVVRVILKSQDVIHSFFVPQFRMKQDAVPGREIRQWFEVVKPGRYEWPCAELCGFGHSGMRGWIYVHTPDEYGKWAAQNLTAEAAPAVAEPKPEGTKAETTRPSLRKRGKPRNERHQRDRARARRARRPPRARLRADLHLLHGPQDDRPAVPVPGALHDDHRRPARPRRPLAARLARDGRARPRRDPHGDRGHPRAQHLQHGVHHARHDHALLRDHADPGGLLREFLHPADDRGARHGVPVPQHALVLGDGQRGPHHALRLFRGGRPRGRRLDLLRAALGGSRVHGRELGPEHLVHQPVHHGRRLDDGVDQLHHDDHQHAGAGHAALSDAARGLVALHHGDPAPPGPAGAHVGRRHAAVRPHARHELVQALGRRRAPPVAAPLLVFRPPGGVHPDPPGDGHRLRDPAGLLPQADLRLPRDGVLDDRDRVPVLDRLRPPHVRQRHEPGARDGLHGHDDGHRSALGHQDVQLAGHPVGRPDPVHRPDAERARVRVDVRHRRALGDLHGLDTGGHLHPGHVLHRGPHPLCRLRRLDLRRVRRDLLLVPEDVRPDDEHGPRPPALLADIRVLQPDLLPDAHHRGRRPDAPYLQPDAVRVPPAPAALERVHHL